MAQSQDICIDHVIRRLANTHTDTVLLSYPSLEGHYDNYTGEGLKDVTDAAISALPSWLKDIARNGGAREASEVVVGVVGVSNLECYIAFLSLQRLGITTMLMSPRLADQGFAHLIRTLGCKIVMASGASLEVLARVRDSAQLDVEIIPMVEVKELKNYRHDKIDEIRALDPRNDDETPGIIIHTGGTTGLPKPVKLRSAVWIRQAIAVTYRLLFNFDMLSTLPIFHSFGLATMIRCLTTGRRLSLLHASRPITVSSIIAGLDKTQAMALATVPYILKFFSETEGGVERLAQLSRVVVGGAATPDELGERLIGAGVKLISAYGQTECGALMEQSADQWNWYVAMPHNESFLKFEPVEDNLYHLIILPGLATKVLSNRPDGSYASNDLFRSHPTDPRKWKFVSRYDDIIVLLNGENADPAPIEQAVASNPNIRVTIAFGAGRDSLGLLVIPSSNASGLSREELVRSIVPNLERGNALVSAYARVAPDDVLVASPETEVPMTDKSTVQRSVLLRQFAAEIESHYIKRESSNAHGGQADLSDVEVAQVVRRCVETELRQEETDEKTPLLVNTDFFSLGMDSLQTSRIRARLLRNIDMRGHHLATNVIFDYPSISLLAEHIINIHKGHKKITRPTQAAAEELVHKYSQFASVEAGTVRMGSQRVLLTGATGFIGCHVLHSLLAQENVFQVYCLVRATSDDAAASRIEKALQDAGIYDEKQSYKIKALACNLGDDHLGLCRSQYESMQISVTTVIHAAWAVNFNMKLESFETPSIAGVSHLLNLAMRSPLEPKPTFAFISSVAAVMRARPLPIREVRHGWAGVSEMGYGQSKWVAEEVCSAAAEHCGLPVQIIRVGQVAGDTRYGIWNPSEAIPATVQSALTIGALPIIESGDQENYWIPVDIAASIIVQLALPSRQAPGATKQSLSIFHVVNTVPLRWNTEFLPTLQRHGLSFEMIPGREWVHRLEKSNPDLRLNPPYRLLEFFKQRYGHIGDEEDGDLRLDIAKSRQAAAALDSGFAIDDELVGKFLKYWTLSSWQGSNTKSNGTAALHGKIVVR
ncbi:uncharacterized protein BCR38DRAFT_505145 [Pseudomassariella vexata]|uniref:Carrier domain-containing protein n=1 Tax=Pseudomassariella vexata TaxID=1141098 RepID=A0A1Y2DAL4_9PEZI|nr:uncharacterized protein BCR38DRAFT_505145 [Pseudomassariella vexata]ORY56310.1 hypothetical protein BCR38DRAFT_505145 [Pseudomassariella vexata]